MLTLGTRRVLGTAVRSARPRVRPRLVAPLPIPASVGQVRFASNGAAPPNMGMFDLISRALGWTTDPVIEQVKAAKQYNIKQSTAQTGGELNAVTWSEANSEDLLRKLISSHEYYFFVAPSVKHALLRLQGVSDPTPNVFAGVNLHEMVCMSTSLDVGQIKQYGGFSKAPGVIVAISRNDLPTPGNAPKGDKVGGEVRFKRSMIAGTAPYATILLDDPVEEDLRKALPEPPARTAGR